MKKKNKKPKKPWTLALREAGLNPKKEIAIIVLGNVLLLVFAAFIYKMTEALIAPISIGLLLVAAGGRGHRGDFFLVGHARLTIVRQLSVSRCARACSKKFLPLREEWVSWSHAPAALPDRRS